MFSCYLPKYWPFINHQKKTFPFAHTKKPSSILFKYPQVHRHELRCYSSHFRAQHSTKRRKTELSTSPPKDCLQQRQLCNTLLSGLQTLLVMFILKFDILSISPLNIRRLFKPWNKILQSSALTESRGHH